MQQWSNIAPNDFFDRVFQNARCYILLPEQDLNYWGGDVTQLGVIYSVEDLAVAVVAGLNLLGYKSVPGKQIHAHEQKDGRILLDIPFQDRLSSKEDGTIRYVLHALKGAAETTSI